MAGEWNRFNERHSGERVGIQGEGINFAQVVDVPALEIEEERSLLADDGAAEVAAELRSVIAGLVGSAEGIGRVESGVVAVDLELAVIFFAAGLC